MSRYSSEVACDSCGVAFRYFLVDNAANESAYGYCDACGATALLSGAYHAIPSEARLGDALGGPISESAESCLQACSCGGSFRGSASPRCPECRHALSAEAATGWLEARAASAREGWRWQGSWQGAFCIVIENRLEQDIWRS